METNTEIIRINLFEGWLSGDDIKWLGKQFIELKRIKNDPQAFWVVYEGKRLGHIAGVSRFGEYTWSLNTKIVDTSQYGLFNNKIDAAKFVYTQYWKKMASAYAATLKELNQYKADL